MQNAKDFFAILGLGITIGVILVIVLVFAMGATPKKVSVGGVEFELPSPTPSTQYVPPQQAVENPPSSSPFSSPSSSVPVATATSSQTINQYPTVEPSIQSIGVEVPSGCDFSKVNSTKLWINSGGSFSIYVDDNLVKQGSAGTGNPGLLINQVIKPGQKVCIVAEPSKGYGVYWGSGTENEYSTYCQRNGCP